jgi:hypothetical protein
MIASFFHSVMLCSACESRPATISCRHFGGPSAPFCGRTCIHNHHGRLVGGRLGLPIASPFETAPGVLRWLEAERDASPLFSDWELPEQGLNIRGGFASMRYPDATSDSVRVIVKRLTPLAARAALAADRLKHVLPGATPEIGSFVARMRFLEPVELERELGNGSRKRVVLGDKLETYLVQRFVEAPTLRRYARDRFGARADVKRLWLPPDSLDRGLLIEFAWCCAYRLALGITDPGPGNFLVQEAADAWEDDEDTQPARRVYSLDEASAFSSQLAPGSAKTWLAANLGRAKGRGSAFDELRPLLGSVAELGAIWRSSDVGERVRAELHRALGAAHASEVGQWTDYVVQNLDTLERDFAALVGAISAVDGPVPPAARLDAMDLVEEAGEVREAFDREEDDAPDAAEPADVIEEVEAEAREEKVQDEEEEEEKPDPKGKTKAKAKPAKRPPPPPPAPLSPAQPYLFGYADLTAAYKGLSVGHEGRRFKMRELKSLLQKSIRRGLKPLAHAAAALMLGSHQVTNLCNRLMTISTEDISLGRVEIWEAAVALARLKRERYSTKKAEYRLPDGGGTVSAARWRAELRNDEQLRSRLFALIEAMCEAPKTRLCDYIGMTCISVGQQQSFGMQPPLVASNLRARLEAARGDLAREQDFFRFVGMHLGGSYNDITQRNVREFLRAAEGAARTEVHKRAVRACGEAIAIRNETATGKFAGKTNLAAAILLCTRDDAEMGPAEPLPPAPAAGAPEVRALYENVISGRNLPSQPLPSWVRDKHTGNVGPHANRDFIVSEELALNPRPRTVRLGDYYEKALELSKKKDQDALELSKKSSKRHRA